MQIFTDGFASITYSYSTGTVRGENKVGGLVGHNDQHTPYTPALIRYSYSIGVVNGASDVGGLVGLNWSYIEGSYYNTETSNQSDKVDDNRGVGKTTEQMKNKDTFVGWNFDSVWGISGTKNNGYPYLLGLE